MAEPRCKPQARFTEAAERVAQPRRGGESSGLPPLPRHRTKRSGTQPACRRTPGSNPGQTLCTADVAGADPVQHVSLPDQVLWVEGSPAAPRHRRPTLPRALGAPSNQGCPAWGSPRAARSSICRLANFPGAGRGGPEPGKPPVAPLQTWEGSDICAPCLDKVYQCLQRCPRPGGCGRAGAHPRQGPTRRTAVVSGDGGGQPAALTMGCSFPGSPSRSVPLLPFLWGAAHTCHPLRSVASVLEGTGCTLSVASAASVARWQRCMVPQAPEPGRHTATCCPRLAGRARGTGSFTPQSGGPPALVPLCLATPQSPALQ